MPFLKAVLWKKRPGNASRDGVSQDGVRSTFFQNKWKKVDLTPPLKGVAEI